LPAATGFDLSNLSNLALAPAGTAPFKMTYGNVAPRIGIAYQVSQNQEWGTVLRGGLGTFYDLRDGEFGNLVGQLAYPFAGLNFFSGGNFPLDSTKAAPPPITPANLSLTAFDPHLKLPYTLQWNVALEQGLGTQQTISASYIGAVGRRLIQTAFVTSPNPNLSQAILVSNPGTSDYHALQLQFQRRLSQGLQALASYTWSHSIDTASAGSSALASNAFVPSAASANRGPSDFDIRNTFSAAVTYDIPSPKINALANAIMRGWSVQNVIQAHSAPPVDVFEGNVLFPQFGLFSADIRPDVVPGQSLYIFGPQYPGRKAFNSTPGLVTCADGSQSVGPFCPPPTDSTGHPLRQGSLGRNALRAFGVAQWDFAVHRDFPIHESLKLQFRAEMFNVLNHPNFAPPFGGINSSQTFGVSTQTLDQYLGGNVAFGGFDALYQTGGPRSIQLALKLQF